MSRGGTRRSDCAGETGPSLREVGAEGATAPETLRQKDRTGQVTLWKADMLQRLEYVSPTG